MIHSNFPNLLTFWQMLIIFENFIVKVRLLCRKVGFEVALFKFKTVFHRNPYVITVFGQILLFYWL